MRKCLLCKREGEVEGITSLGSFRTSSEVRRQGGEATMDASANPWGHFMLTKLFNLSEKECEELLETGGGVWDVIWIKICGNCVQFVTEFRDRHEELLELERKLDSMRKEACGKLLGSRVDGGGDDECGGENAVEGSRFAHERIRIYFRGVFDILGTLSPSRSQADSHTNCIQDPTNPTTSSSGVEIGPGQEIAAPDKGLEPGPTSSPYHGRTRIEEPYDETEIYAAANIDMEIADQPRTRHDDSPSGSASSSLEMTAPNDKDDPTTVAFQGAHYNSGSEAENCFDEEMNHAVGLEINLGRTELIVPSGEAGTSTSDSEIDSEQPISSEGNRSQGKRKFQEKKAKRNQLNKRNPLVEAFVCETCMKGFDCKSNLKRHIIMSHTNGKAHICVCCGKGFSQPSNLNVHLPSHMFEKPYFCTECGKEFLQSSSVVRHIRSHSGVTPYKCEICKMGFSQVEYLKIHYRVHTTERPFMCKHCNKGFTTKSNLITHGKRKNPCH